MFDTILIANRGEIARRIIRTCNRLGIHTVAIYSDADEHAPHVCEATKAVRVGSAPVKESYLNRAAIVEAALATGAQAIHPGYGLLSENSDFARHVVGAGLTFIGPPVSVLEAFGDKMRARHVALSVGVAPVPGTDQPFTFDQVDLARNEANKIGFPIVVKAVGGGGGIGMQIVRDEVSLERALKTCADRALQAFSDARIYLERYLERPRHIEVQIFCDRYQNSVALGERECSLQRRHQKILEESPSPLLQGEQGARIRSMLFERALAVVNHVGYVGAGTVEFIVHAQSPEQPYFLEVNARLQVEHPVTEMCTKLDLVEAQLRVAAGESLPYELKNASPSGHAVEVRIYAEEPRKNFLPRPGPIDVLTWPQASSNVRVEGGVEQGSKVTPYYDPMIAKIIAHASTRDEALDRLDHALATTQMSPIVTNIEFLRDVLAEERFRAGEYDTLFAEAFAKISKKS